METLRAELSTEFDVLGFLGRSGDRTMVYLARDLASSNLVALTVEAEGEDEYGNPAFSLSVREKLDASVPDVEALCPQCRSALRPWARFCTQCGADVSGISASTGSRHSREDLLEAVRAEAGQDYEVLGEMAREEGGGLVYFAKDRSNGRIVGLRLIRQGERAYALNVTRVLKPLPPPKPRPRGTERISLVRRQEDLARIRKEESERSRAGRESRRPASPAPLPTPPPPAAPRDTPQGNRPADRRLVAAVVVIVILVVSLALAVLA